MAFVQPTSLIAQRYRILQPIGNGGMGIVYQGMDMQTNEMVAVKHLKPELLAQSPGVLNRFAREGEALRQLNHPNIVRVLATLEENDQHYIIMEYVGGGSLTDLLNRQSCLDISDVLKIGLEVADALSRAHHLKITHRDIKPDNILLAEDGTPRLTDFGIAHIARRDESTITQTGILLGTYPYLCPEAFAGKILDARADIWAFGVMLFEMLAGQRPFKGDSMAALMSAIVNQPTPDLEALRPDAPVSLVDLIYRMLEKNPDERISSARLVAASLESMTNNVALQHPSERFPEIPIDPDMTPLATPASGKHTNLPPQTTPFVGRENELAKLDRLLANPVTRLISIVGSGGMGKTRLALEVAAGQMIQFPDGVYLIELAPLGSAENIVTAVADAIGIQFAQGSHPKEQLLNSFHDKKMLLVMDNFEHLLDGIGIVSEILQAAPNVKIITTSRERLNLSNETLFILAGMDFPDWETPEEALNYAAVKLFIQSAARIKPDFDLLADDLKILARICRLVVGMPMGIVLTAAWVSMLSLNEIADEIERNLDFLETDLADVPERQRSIRSVFDYSYNRLNADEQSAFRKMSIFRGGCTREAAQFVAGASLKTLMTLMNKALLRRDSEGRYQIHELLRQYGEQKLVAAGEAQAAREAHTAFFVRFLQQRWEDLKGRRQIRALDEIGLEFENIRLAWAWLVEHRRERDLGEIASSLWFYIDVAAHYHEGVELFRQAVEASRSETPPGKENWVLGHLLGRLAWFQRSIGLFEKSRLTVQDALAILRGSDHPEETIMALYSVADSGLMHSEYIDVVQAGEEAYLLAQKGVNDWAKCHALRCRAMGLYFTGKDAEARQMQDECVALSKEMGNYWLIANLNSDLSWVALEQGNYPEAEKLSRQALQVCEALHNSWGISYTCIRLGASLIHQGYEAEPYFYRGIKIIYDLGVNRETLVRILTTVEHYFLPKDPIFAVELLSLILHHPNCDKAIAGWTEKTIKLLKAELQPDAYQAAWQRGKRWTLDQAVTLVLDRLC